MPSRPPKKWFRSCVRGVKKSGSSYDPPSVCGDLWHNKMKAVDKRKAIRLSEK